MTTSADRKKYQARNRAKKRTSRAESIAMQSLERGGIPYKHQMILGFFILDLALMERMLVIEIDGGYHETPRQRWYDRKRDEFIKRCGFEVVHLKNEEAHLAYELAISHKEHHDFMRRFNKATGKANALMDVANLNKKKREELELLGQQKLI